MLTKILPKTAAESADNPDAAADSILKIITQDGNAKFQ